MVKHKDQNDTRCTSKNMQNYSTKKNYFGRRSVQKYKHIYEEEKVGNLGIS